MNVFSRFGHVFIAPSKTFTSIRDDGTKWRDYVVTFVLIIALAIIMSILISDIVKDVTADAIRNMDRIAEAQKELAIQQATSPTSRAIQLVTQIVFQVAGILLGALFIWIVGNFVGGGDQKYGKVLATSLFIQMIAIPEMILKTILILQKEAVTVYIGFGSLVANADQSSFLVQFVNQLEFFAIWRLILWVIAFKALYNFSSKKSSILVIATMLIGFLLMAGLATMNAGRFG